MSNDSYADLDVDSSDSPGDTSIVINYDDETHVVGAPPSDDYSDDVSDFSGDSDLDLANETEYVDQTVENTIDVDNPPQALPRHLISAETPSECMTDLVGYADHFMKHYLTASLCAAPLLLRTGFTPDDVDKCVRDTMQISVTAVASQLIGSQLGTLMANSSTLEACHALAKTGWLKVMDGNGMFYPVLPESEKLMVEQLIDGAEACRSHEDRKKREAEQYPSEEAEIQAILTYNMICELMVAVMKDLQRNRLIYTDISNAFEHMVTGLKYTEILMKYKRAGLELDKEERWNGKWFTKYTNRSTLKKFVTMPKFSGIVADNQKGSEFRFRNETESVRLFNDADLKEVRDRWNQGNNQNEKFDRKNGNRSGNRPRDNSRGPGTSQTRPADPNFQPPTLSGGIDNVNDNRRTDNSANNGRRRYDSPSPPPRRNRSPSPSPPPSPPTLPTTEPAFHPFGGPSAEPLQAPPTSNRAPMQVAYLDSDSSTENEVSSQGSYSDEDSDQKRSRDDRREKERVKKLKKKERRKEEKAKKPPAPVNQAPNRFAQSSFPPNNDTTIQSEAPPTSPPVAPPVAPSTAPSAAPPPEPPRQMEAPPLAISRSRFDEDNQTKMTILYHSAPEQMALNRRKEEEEKKRAEQEEADRIRSMHVARGHPEPASAPAPARQPVQHPAFRARQEEFRQQQRAQPLNEPQRAGGLGSRRRTPEVPRAHDPYAEENRPPYPQHQMQQPRYERAPQNAQGNRHSPNEYAPGMQPQEPSHNHYQPPPRYHNDYQDNYHSDHQMPPRNEYPRNAPQSSYQNSHQNQWQNQNPLFEDRRQYRQPMGRNDGYDQMRNDTRGAQPRDTYQDCYSTYQAPPPSFNQSMSVGGVSQFRRDEGSSSTYNPHTAINPDTRYKGKGISLFSRAGKMRSPDEEKAFEKAKIEIAMFIRTSTFFVTMDDLEEAQNAGRLQVPNNQNIIRFIDENMSNLIKKKQRCIENRWTHTFEYDL